MKSLFTFVLLAILITTSAFARLKEGTYIILKDNDVIGEVYAEKANRSGKLIEHWVLYSQNGFVGIAPLPSPYPNPDKIKPSNNKIIGIEPNPSPFPVSDISRGYELSKINAGFKNAEEFLKSFKKGEISKYFILSSMELSGF